MSVVTFDLWNTLLSLDPDEARSYVLRRHGIGRRWLERSPPRAGGPQGDLRRIPPEVRAEADRWERVGRVMTIPEQARRMARLANRRADPRTYERSLSRLSSSLPVKVAPGARDCLRALRRDGLTLGLISNLTLEPPGAVRHLLYRTGLAPFFSTLVLSSEVGASKPDLRPFRVALSRLKAVPAQAVHVGDRWSSDGLGAVRAGWAGVIMVGPSPIPRSARGHPRVRQVGSFRGVRAAVWDLLSPTPGP
jgi:FMN phosphatase YigB (HAD superfamily)